MAQEAQTGRSRQQERRARAQPRSRAAAATASRAAAKGRTRVRGAAQNGSAEAAPPIRAPRRHPAACRAHRRDARTHADRVRGAAGSRARGRSGSARVHGADGRGLRNARAGRTCAGGGATNASNASHSASPMAQPREGRARLWRRRGAPRSRLLFAAGQGRMRCDTSRAASKSVRTRRRICALCVPLSSPNGAPMTTLLQLQPPSAPMRGARRRAPPPPAPTPPAPAR